MFPGGTAPAGCSGARWTRRCEYGRWGMQACASQAKRCTTMSPHARAGMPLHAQASPAAKPATALTPRPAKLPPRDVPGPVSQPKGRSQQPPSPAVPPAPEARTPPAGPPQAAASPAHRSSSAVPAAKAKPGAKSLMLRIRLCKSLEALQALADEQAEQMDEAHLSSLAYTAAQLGTRRQAGPRDLAGAQVLVAAAFGALQQRPPGQNAIRPASVPFMLWAAAKAQYSVPPPVLKLMVATYLQRHWQGPPASPPTTSGGGAAAATATTAAGRSSSSSSSSSSTRKPPPDSLQLSMLCWSAARLGYRDPAAWRRLGPLVSSAARHMPPQSLTNCLWAFATVGYSSQQVLDALLQRVAATMGQFNALDVANTLWALGKLQYKRAAPLAADLAAAAQRLLPSCDLPSLVRIAWACAALELPSCGPLLRGIVQRVLPGVPACSALQLSCMAWACAKQGLFDLPLFEAAAPRLGRQAAGGELGPQELALAAWAYARLRADQPGRWTHDNLMRVLARCAQEQLSSLTAQGLAMTAWALASSGHLGPALWQALVQQALAPPQLRHYTPASLNMLLAAGGAAQAAGLRVPTRLVSFAATLAHSMIERFDHVEMCDLLERMAAIAPPPPQLLDALAQRALDTQLRGFLPESLSRMAAAFASAGHMDEELFAAVAEASLASMDGFQAGSLARTARAYASMGIHDVELLQSVALAAKAQLPALQPRDVASLLWAFASLNQEDVELLEACLSHVQQWHGSYSAQELADVVFATAAAGRYSPELLAAVSARMQAALPSWPIGCIAKVLWAMATLRHYDAALLAAVSAHLAACGGNSAASSRRGTDPTSSTASSSSGSRLLFPAAEPQELSHCALALVMFRQPATGALNALAGGALQRLGELLPEDLSLLAWALSVHQLLHGSPAGAAEGWRLPAGGGGSPAPPFEAGSSAQQWPPLQLALLQAVSASGLASWQPASFSRQELCLLHEAALCSTAAAQACGLDEGPLALPLELAEAASRAWSDKARPAKQGRPAQELRAALQQLLSSSAAADAAGGAGTKGDGQMMLGGVAVGIPCVYQGLPVAFQVLQPEDQARNAPSFELASSSAVAALLRLQGVTPVAVEATGAWRQLQDEHTKAAYLQALLSGAVVAQLKQQMMSDTYGG